MQNEWQDISKIEEYRDNYEFNEYAVLVADTDDDGEEDGGTYTDIAFGIALMPENTKRFCLIPYDEENV